MIDRASGGRLFGIIQNSRRVNLYSQYRVWSKGPCVAGFLEIGFSVLEKVPIRRFNDGQDKENGGTQQYDVIPSSSSPRYIRQSDEKEIYNNEKCEVFTHRGVWL